MDFKKSFEKFNIFNKKNIETGDKNKSSAEMEGKNKELPNLSKDDFLILRKEYFEINTEYREIREEYFKILKRIEVYGDNIKQLDKIDDNLGYAEYAMEVRANFKKAKEDIVAVEEKLEKMREKRKLIEKEIKKYKEFF